jgi:hypothetical protein
VRRAVRALAQPKRAPVATAAAEASPGCDEDSAIFRTVVSASANPSTPEDLAAGTHPGIELPADAEQELAGDDKTLPRILLGEVTWQPIRAEDLGASSAERPLLHTLRQTGPAAVAAADASEGQDQEQQSRK